MKRAYKLIENIHLYLGLFISPVIILFSLSAIILNHEFVSWQEDWQDWNFSVDDIVDRTAQFTLPNPDGTKVEIAKDIINQLDIEGEISNVFGDSSSIYIPVTKPGYRISIKADLVAGIAYIHSIETAFWQKLVWLHKMPGPHNSNIRGNWGVTNLWQATVDFSVISLLISSITGIILWIYIKAERSIGLIALAIGLLSLVSLILGLII